MLTAQCHDTCTLGWFYVRTGRIVRVDEHQCSDEFATGLAEQPLEFGDVDEPGAVELQLVFDRVNAFKPCNRLNQRIAGFGCQHRVAGIAK